MIALGPTAASAAAAVLPTPAARAAREFESMFLAEMLAPMFQGVGRDALFGSAGQEIWSSMLTQEYGRALAARGGLGLGASAMHQLMLHQEVQ